MTTAGLPSGQPIRGQKGLPDPPPGGFTSADLPRLIEVIDARFEILDGEVHIMPSPTHWHDEAVETLKRELRRIAPPWLAVTREKNVALGSFAPVPDVLVVSRAVVTAASYVFLAADVHLAIEVMSPRTKAKDRVDRPGQYASAGIACFWRVENEDGAMVVHTFQLGPGGGYEETGVFRGRVKADHPFPIDIELPEITW